jgi:hypothetical protein
MKPILISDWAGNNWLTKHVVTGGAEQMARRITE